MQLFSRKTHTKYAFIHQRSEEDCGIACLIMIAQHYGRRISFSHARKVCGTGQNGTNLDDLRRGAESLGFESKAGRASSELINHIEKIPLPAIIHWKSCHWVVLYAKEGNKFVIADPSDGIRYLSKKALLQGWSNGVMLLLEPNPASFYQQEDDEITHVDHFSKRVWAYKNLLIITFICALTIGVLSLAMPLLIQLLTDNILAQGNTALLNRLIVVIIAINFLSSGLQLVQSLLITQFVQRLELGFILDFCRKILCLPISYFEARRSGEVISRLQDLQEINQLISQVVVSLPSQFFIAVVSLILMISYSKNLTLVAVSVAVLSVLSTTIFLPALQQRLRKTLILEAENQGVLVETFKNVLSLKIITAAADFWQEFQSDFTKLARLKIQALQIGATYTTFAGFVSSVGSLGLLWYGSRLVISGELSLGELFAFNGMNANFLTFITGLIGLFDEYVQIKLSIERSMEIIEEAPESNEHIHKPAAIISSQADIVFKNVTFRHFRELNLEIPGSKVTALIGTSGCGKSSLVKLVARLHSLESGTIEVGDYTHRDLSLECWRQQVALVPQEAQFWKRSIIENFQLATSSEAEFKEIVEACKVAGADEFIKNLPDTYDTVLGEFAANISGGQKQRLAIARGILNNPPVLILDEATSGLDTQSECDVFHRLLARRKGKTTIIISHRPSVVELADWVVVLEQGELKFQGYPKNLPKE